MTGKTYRLLSEAEWEYAARAGTTTLYSFGDDEAALGEHAWYVENSEYMTHLVGEKKPNPFGFYDMHGNVWELVEDCVHGDYSGAPKDGSAWTAKGDCHRHMIRGGSWTGNPDYLRSADRNEYTSVNRSDNLGFRVGRTLTP
jgi:formylglycine-generating enzyme required for sulfatase activity